MTQYPKIPPALPHSSTALAFLGWKVTQDETENLMTDTKDIALIIKHPSIMATGDSGEGHHTGIVEAQHLQLSEGKRGAASF